MDDIGRIERIVSVEQGDQRDQDTEDLVKGRYRRTRQLFIYVDLGS